MGGDGDKKSPFLSKAGLDDEDFKLSPAEKRERVENELKTLRQRCQTAGLTPSQVRSVASPFVSCVRAKNRVKLFRNVFVCSLLTAAFSGLLLNKTSNDWIVTHLRLFSIHVIRPYWDFTIYYNDQCIFLNPLFDESSLRGELDCKGVCKELGENIETMEAKGANPSVIFDDYLQANIPLVVNNAFDNWRATDELSIAKLAELYSSDPVLSTAEVCDVTGLKDFEAVMKRLKHPEKTKSMSVTWFNCKKEAYKQFRKFYKRPAFLPPAAEAVHSNFVIVSMGKDKARPRDGVVIPPGPEGEIAHWIAQVKGELEYTMVPVRECAEKCDKIFTFVMKPGDFLLVPLDMWEVSFRPVSRTADDAIAVGSGLMWDVSG